MSDASVSKAKYILYELDKAGFLKLAAATLAERDENLQRARDLVERVLTEPRA